MAEAGKLLVVVALVIVVVAVVIVAILAHGVCSHPVLFRRISSNLCSPASKSSLKPLQSTASFQIFRCLGRLSTGLQKLFKRSSEGR